MQTSIDFKDFNSTSRTKASLGALPEYEQDLLFRSELQQYLVRKLELKSEKWRKLIENIWHQLGENGYVVIKGLPFDKNNRLSTALASMLGTPVPHNSKVPSLVREIPPRPGSEPLENSPHTDSPHWICPNDLILLECKTEDQAIPVYSRVPLASSVGELINERYPQLYQRLFEQKYPFILIPDDGDGGIQMQPVFSRVHEGGKERTHVRFCYPDSASCVSDYKLSSDYLEDLAYVRVSAQEVGETNQFLFHLGDWLIFDNKRIFHSKSETSDNTQRVLKKIKLRIDRNRMYCNLHPEE
jgi:hypothetical protein